MDPFEITLQKIKSHRIPGIPLFEGQIHPDYNGYSIANIPDSICRWLNIPTSRGNGLAEEYHQGLDADFEHIIFVLVDGLSLRLFGRFREEILNGAHSGVWKSFFQKGHFLPLTSVCPSTTSAALTTLWTGRYPSEHGVIGYELFLKEYGLIANMITHSVASFIKSPVHIRAAGFDPLTFLPVDTLGGHFLQFGIQAFAFQHESIADSGLSRMLFPHVQTLRFKDLNDLWASVHQLLAERHTKTYVYIYWSGLDTLSHHVGPDSQALYEEWQKFADISGPFIQRLQKAHSTKTLFLLCADHGQIATQIVADYDLRNHPGLSRHWVMVPTGESRLPFLNIKPGEQKAVRRYLDLHWDGLFSMLSAAEVQSAGLMGARHPHQTTIDRMGSHIVFPRGNAYWWWVEKENHLLGRHGGLSAAEMLVPFFALPI